MCVIAFRQTARTSDRWLVLPRVYAGAGEALAAARRARLRFPMLDFRTVRRSIAERFPGVYRQ